MSELLKYFETTKPTISGQEVGISNILQRKLPDADGVVAARLSVELDLIDRANDTVRREYLAVDGTVQIGADRYCVVEIQAGTPGPGWVSLVRVE
jgi:hypothetical protein